MWVVIVKTRLVPVGQVIISAVSSPTHYGGLVACTRVHRWLFNESRPLRRYIKWWSIIIFLKSTLWSLWHHSVLASETRIRSHFNTTSLLCIIREVIRHVKIVSIEPSSFCSSTTETLTDLSLAISVRSYVPNTWQQWIISLFLLLFSFKPAHTRLSLLLVHRAWASKAVILWCGSHILLWLSMLILTVVVWGTYFTITVAL